ncbi:hypothetical protein X777_06281 [Ooceraea biroi]|uniref:Uncharacterized protein n=1 Tax=Ooceraea biroi TaxID=2015173 RepID=A0A026WAT0_OOCBI|nr:hypothetical protein X777_06281 [Ooceraea biroi]
MEIKIQQLCLPEVSSSREIKRTRFASHDSSLNTCLDHSPETIFFSIGGSKLSVTSTSLDL